MKTTIKRWSLNAAVGVLALGFANAVLAQEQPDANAAIKQAIGKLLPGVEVETIKPLTLPPLYEVVVGAEVLYVTQDGRFAMQGDLVDLPAQANLTENTRAKARMKFMSALDPKDMIIFAPAEVKHTVTVFTDIDCPYCRKMHSEMADYNREGIAFRYLAFPRAGMGSESYYKAVAVWCAADRKAAMTAAKGGQPVKLEDKNCANPVSAQLELAHQLNVSGTPTMVLEDGSIVPGYLPPARLKSVLDNLGKGS